VPFVKLHAAILDSSIWLEPAHVRIVWITMLAMADAAGCVQASPRGLAHRANVTPEECSDALGRFLGPDADSRDGTDGRRIEAVRGGWRLLNYLEFRNRREAEDRREYQARWWRDNKGRKTAADLTHLDTPRHASTNSTQAEAEAEAEKKTPRSRAAARPADVADEVWQDFAALRRQRRATVTSTVLDGIRREATAAGMSLEQALRTCVERGWQSFRADWATAPAARGPSLAKQAAHVPNMPLGHASCSCAGCTSYRAKRP
jgi:hypothetical protein